LNQHSNLCPFEQMRSKAIIFQNFLTGCVSRLRMTSPLTNPVTRAARLRKQYKLNIMDGFRQPVLPLIIRESCVQRRRVSLILFHVIYFYNDIVY